MLKLLYEHFPMNYYPSFSSSISMLYIFILFFTSSHKEKNLVRKNGKYCKNKTKIITKRKKNISMCSMNLIHAHMESDDDEVGKDNKQEVKQIQMNTEQNCTPHNGWK